MKYFFLIAGLFMPGIFLAAQNEPSALSDSPKRPGLAKQPLFTWDLLWTGSWEESKTLHNRGDFRIGLTRPGLTLRGQALDRRPLNFQLDPPWGDPSKAIGGASFGMYHKATGSRLLYGVLDEWGLPARTRSPWIRSAPYPENHKPVMADLKTVSSSTKKPEAYMYLSTPRFELFQDSVLPEMSMRGFSSAQCVTEGELAPAFSLGLETFIGKKTELLLEGFYTGAELSAKTSSSWFSDPPSLPARDFNFGAAGLMLNTTYFSLASDWAWSETFAWGRGIYGNAGIRLSPPLSGDTKGKQKAGPWSVSLAADGAQERYTGRDGSTPGSGFRTAGKIEWKGPRSGFFRAGTTLRSPGMDEAFNRSSTGLYYRFPAPSARAGSTGGFPLRVSRISLNADRNAANPEKILDSIDATLGLSLNLPPVSLPGFSRKANTKNAQAIGSPLGINLSAALKGLSSAGDTPSPYPAFQADREFESGKLGCELLWSPGMYQFRTKWGYTASPKKDDQWDASLSAAIRFKQGRFSIKTASPDFPRKWNYTVSWRMEL